MEDDIIEVVSVKPKVINTLNAILHREATAFEEGWDDMTMTEAMEESDNILKFRKHIERINNIDL